MGCGGSTPASGGSAPTSTSGNKELNNSDTNKNFTQIPVKASTTGNTSSGNSTTNGKHRHDEGGGGSTPISSHGSNHGEERKEESRTVKSAPKQNSSNLSIKTKTDEKDSILNTPPTPQQLAAVQRIQRLARNKSAWRLAQQEREWRVCIPH